MSRLLLSLFSLLRLKDDRLSDRAKFQVQMHRLLSLLGAALILGFAPLYALAGPSGTDPLWARFGVAGLLVGLFSASYFSFWIRARFVACVQGAAYVTMGWFASIATLNQFSVDYATGLLLVYVMLAAVVGFGARSMSRVLWFLAYGFLLTTAGLATGLLVGPPSSASAPVFLGSMSTVAVVEGILTRGWLRIQERIREQESRFRGLANSLPGAVFQFYAREDGSVGHRFVSEHTEEILGISSDPDGFLERCLSRVPEGSRREMERSIREAVETESRWEFETPFDRPSGDRIWAYGASVPERREGENVFNGVILDITERRRAEQAREEERARLESLFEALPTPVARCEAHASENSSGPEGLQVSDVNAAFEEAFGVDASDARGRDVNEILVPSGKEGEARSLGRRALEEGTLRAEVQRETPEEVRDFRLQASCRRPGDGPPEVYAIYTDITGRKRRERRLSAIFNQTYQFTGLMKPDGTVIEVNDTALQFGDLTREEVTGKPLWETHWAQTGEESKKRLKEAIQRAAEGELVRYERPVRGSEEALDADFSIRPVTDEEGDVTLLIPEARDITELKERERKLREAKEEAEKARREAEEAKEEAESASRAKSAMLANMSHEIRTPLTSVIGFAEAIGEETSEEAPASRFAGLIQKSGKRLLRTLDGVLNLSKLEAGRAGLTLGPVDLEARAREAAKEASAKAEKKGVDVRLETGPARARADEGAAEIIVQNLLSNAIKYTEEGGTVWVRTRQESRIQQEKSAGAEASTEAGPEAGPESGPEQTKDGRAPAAAVLEVEDTGIGMEPEEVEAMFEPFRQESEGLSREYEGTGLGLTVAQRAAEQMGGSIEVDTEKGEGSRFVARLPGADPKAGQDKAGQNREDR
ncbi:PAS domain S-box-containing protein [Salinibacter ruber]|uniref:PAS domain S-box protein n=1 Tax=Salinibacter ruber TaxID=146919 RepID=UPI002167763B|nr:PAS domain S-box protein [Salinibacter ruber]MCS3830724.1 PAS domain S-box-containing protein [Salinibacter ruber]MCS4057198.1 PAS domain S-box-containing protein [Salinibacter ruber]MCS4162202.1 PAS domain S-box-containing protein [Salinibacter ruber]